MVQAMIQISEHINRILNIIKAKYGLKNKSEAIELVTEKYEEEMLEPELRPEFIEEMKHIEKTARYVKVKNVDEYFKKLAKR